MEDFMHYSLNFDICSTCKNCCNFIPTCICAFHILEGIENKIIEPKYIQNLVLYKISEDNLEKAALTWRHFPSINILQNMTIENNGYFEILAIPKSNAECPFLGEKGCIYPRLKPFNCATFPFYYEKKILKKTNSCLYLNQIETDNIKKELSKLTEKYISFCKDHKTDYLSLLNKLNDKFSWNIHIFR